MSTHLYCLLPYEQRTAVTNGVAGIDGAPVRALAADGFAVWVSDVPDDLPLTMERVRAHDDVVEAALSLGVTPAPVRFGQRFKNDGTCLDALARRAPALNALVTDVQGCVEMTLLLTPSTRRMLRDLEPVVPQMLEPSGGYGPGTRYLEALRAREAQTGVVRRAMDELAERLSGAVNQFIRRATSFDQPTSLPLRTISHLVSREDVDAYKRAVNEVHAGGEFRFLVIGPRAPYSFSASPADGGGPHGMKLAD